MRVTGTLVRRFALFHVGVAFLSLHFFQHSGERFLRFLPGFHFGNLFVSGKQAVKDRVEVFTRRFAQRTERVVTGLESCSEMFEHAAQFHAWRFPAHDIGFH